MTVKSTWKTIGFILINIMGLLLFSFRINDDQNMTFAIFACIQCVFGLLLLKDAYPIYSVAPLFLIVSEVMHFGEAFILGIGREDLLDVSNVVLAGSIKNYNIANIFAFSVQTMVVVGMIYAGGSRKKYKLKGTEKIDRLYQHNKNITYSVGLLLFLIGVGPTMLYYGKMLQQTLSGITYVGIRESVDLGPLLLLTVFFHPGVILMILGSLDSPGKLKAKLIFYLACVFEVVCMLTGNRGQQLMYLLVYIFIYYRYVGKFNWKKILPFALLGYVTIAFLYAISSTRLYGFAGFDLNAFTKVLMGEPILALLAEQGSTLNMVALTVRDVPSYTPFSYGIQYLASLLSVLPDTGGWKGGLVNLVGTLSYLNTKLPLGDSYIAELYHNFGWFAMPFASMIGFFIGRVDQRIEQNVKENNYLYLGSYLILFRSLLWMVRCNFFNFLYDFVWSYVIIYLATNIVVRYKKRF